MKTVRVAINGAGRIGRSFYKLSRQMPDIEVVAFNDLADIENIAYLLKYDSVYGKSDFDVTTKDGSLVVDSKEIKYLSEKDPSLLPWKDLEIDIVVESTGAFVTYEKSKAHLLAGAKRVVVTAPMKDEPTADIPGATVLMGINEEKLSTCIITSNASCTTNAGSPLMAILDEAIGIEKAVLNTVHGYTASQSLVDGPSKKDMREGRAAAQNIVPSSTGAAIAVTKALPNLSGMFDGIAMRVPVVAGSMVDITFVAKRETSAEEVNQILKEAALKERWKGIFAVTEEELVSTDIIGSTYGSIADLALTRVVGGNLVKVMAWYDNEMGYCHTLVSHVSKIGKLI
jgi:glyceraldehyde 3-phosphate dehydrogenase